MSKQNKNHNTGNQVVLITGCSSGIGRNLSESLYKRGYIVVATARNRSQIKDLKVSMKLELDVTNEESIMVAVRQIIIKYERIDILVNNAGYSIRGALEEVDISQIKKMYDVNIFGIVRMIQAVIPVMRNQQYGKIINIGSISGRFSQAINGAYCSTKFAVEALNQALRLELYPDHIQSTVIEPGPIQTHFFDKLSQNSDELMSDQKSPYQKFYKVEFTQRELIKKLNSKKAASQIADIIFKPKLKCRYKIGVTFKFHFIILLPDFIRENILKVHVKQK